MSESISGYFEFILSNSYHLSKNVDFRYTGETGTLNIERLMRYWKIDDISYWRKKVAFVGEMLKGRSAESNYINLNSL